MKIVLAPNSFKECLSAPLAAQALARGVMKGCPEATCIAVPVADGGDGTCEALVSARQGVYREIAVNDPLFRPLYARYGLIDEGKTAVIEMAAASGLWILAPDEKDPMHTSTYGTGELIRDAIEQGVDSILLGIGGSATVDGGIGMAAALGYRLLDREGRDVHPVGGKMGAIAAIDASQVHPRLREVAIQVACDVTNPLLGGEGAVAVYGPQKGASAETMPMLEAGLENLTRLWQRDLGVSIHAQLGGGAAGGLVAGLVAFCGASLESGFELIAGYARLDEAMQGADLVLTGEGKIDESTAFGKVPAGVGRHAKRGQVPVVVLAGAVSGDLRGLFEQGITAVFSIADGPMDLATAIHRAESLLEQAAEQVTRMWRCRIEKSTEKL
jgi:glycerate kinase